MRLIVMIFSILVLNSCGCAKATTGVTQSKMTNLNKTEQLSGEFTVALMNNSVTAVKNITLKFNENKISGFSGCNTYTGSYKQKGNTLQINNIITTRMYCKEASDTERVFLECLSKTNSFILNGDNLLLKTDETVLLNTEKNTVFKNKKQINNKAIAIYESHTRGYHFTATMYDTYLTVVKELNGTPKRMDVSPEDVAELRSIISKLVLKDINTFEAPTKKRHYDGAPHSSISVFKDDEKFSSQTFDGGFPPKPLVELVNKVLSLSTEK